MTEKEGKMIIILIMIKECTKQVMHNATAHYSSTGAARPLAAPPS